MVVARSLTMAYKFIVRYQRTASDQPEQVTEAQK